VFYESLAALTAADADGDRDVYTTAGDGPELVSHGGDGSEGIQFEAATADGGSVLLSSHEPLTAGDTDPGARDWYLARRAVATTPDGDIPVGDVPAGQDGTADQPQTGPVPVEGKLFNAERVSGTVLVRVPGGTSFVPLTQLTSIPNGSLVDARKGRVRLYTTDGRGGVQFSDFFGGMFRITQQRGGLVELTLAGGSFRGCPPVRGARARAAGSAKGIRKLWGSGHGKFRTRGRFAAATVRGTTWLTEDRCSGTLVRVKEGAVVARDLVKRRNVVLRAGRQYLAAAKATAARKRRR
jgi:hypothetical protein